MRLREQRLDLEWLDIWHDAALITVYTVFISVTLGDIAAPQMFENVFHINVFVWLG